LQKITFKDRVTAESFFFGPHDVPGVGKLEFKWINTPLPPVTNPTHQDGDTEMQGFSTEGNRGEASITERNQSAEEGEIQDENSLHDRDEDYDVAEEHEWIT
jgi:hypothetical protein